MRFFKSKSKPKRDPSGATSTSQPGESHDQRPLSGFSTPSALDGRPKEAGRSLSGFSTISVLNERPKTGGRSHRISSYELLLQQELERVERERVEREDRIARAWARAAERRQSERERQRPTDIESWRGGCVL
ncbi:hypothetical protein B2J93_5891 [Marssonina coronariae]|uniref:Uncharacterized protein n=1 Tax=Diplocarpon coronariae TaxID=2795749 RepID=A0A218ZCJ4_9HELO|nr:hypothetical protein B2J93_5891 [Marssonina coronariae]